MNLIGKEMRNFLIYAIHSAYRIPTATPFRGNLSEAKLKAREILSEQGSGWTVKVETDGQIIYSEMFV
jgi:hypothetical protein